MDKYYSSIKNKLIDNALTKKAKDYSKNKSDLDTYYYVGKKLFEAGKNYGEGVIKKYSISLTKELGNGYSPRNLRNMRQFYLFCKNKKWQTLSAKLSWSHYVELIFINDINEVNYYIRIIEEQNLGVRSLRQRIKSNEYQRLPETTKNKLIESRSEKIGDFIKNPIVISDSLNYKEISERALQKLILEDISNFLKELGPGFCFIDNEYKIMIGDRYNYIDIFLFNIIYHCYVVVELKVTELKKEDIGQIQVYMNYIDKNVKNIYHDKTIGIIISKRDNKVIIEYSSDPRIYSTTYLIKK